MKCWLAMLWVWLGAANAWEVRGEKGRPNGETVVAGDHMKVVEPSWAAAKVATDPADLKAAAQAALDWIRLNPEGVWTGVGLFEDLGVSDDQAVKTLETVVQASPSQLTDGAWWARHFSVYRWQADAAGMKARDWEPQDGKIRLTKYFVPEVVGSLESSAEYPVALYADPGRPWRTKYTRKQAFSGVYESDGEAAGLAMPLVWLSAANAHDAMMQGTIKVRTHKGAKLLNVHKNNGYAYKKGHSSESQDRLWYFREVSDVRGWGPSRTEKMKLVANASVAGDMWNLGLGQVVVLEIPNPETGALTLRPVVMADTGGAFQPNLYQLDFYAGTHKSHAALYAATADVPDWVWANVVMVQSD